MYSCGEINRKITLWETEGRLSEEDLAAVREHIENCAACGKRYRALFLLISGDLTAELPAETEKKRKTGELTSSVMKEVRKMKPAGKAKLHSIFYPIAAAAAAVIITVFSIHIFNPLQSTQPGTVVVEFRLAAPSVSSVTLVGDFNNWEENGIILTDDDGDGLWTAVVTLKKGNIYKYNFIVDNETWIADPESEIKIADGFGGESSVIHI